MVAKTPNISIQIMKPQAYIYSTMKPIFQLGLQNPENMVKHLGHLAPFCDGVSVAALTTIALIMKQKTVSIHNGVIHNERSVQQGGHLQYHVMMALII